MGIFHTYIKLVYKANRQYYKDFVSGIKLDDNQQKLYRKEQKTESLKRIRIGHVIATLIILSFALYDLMIIDNWQIYKEVTAIRLLIIGLVMVPFYLLTFSKKASKYIKPAIGFTYLIFGAFIIYIAYTYNYNQELVFHNYVGALMLILGMYIFFNFELSFPIYMSIIFVLGYNFGFFLHQSNHELMPERMSSDLMMGLNIWFLLISISGFLLSRFFQQLTQKNFLANHILTQQKLDLQEANDVKNRFFSLVGHDLKNLISSQYSFSELLQDKTLDIDEVKRNNILVLMQNSSAKTLDLLEELMTWSKVETSNFGLKQASHKLTDLAEDTIKLFEYIADKKQITITNAIESDTLVFCDKNAQKTILRNLIGNAIKFSHKNSEIIVTAAMFDKQVAIQVIDTGVGINCENISSIFKKEEIKSTRGTVGEEGTGFGLLLCQQLIKLNKGQIWVDSKLNYGTTITYTTPKAS